MVAQGKVEESKKKMSPKITAEIVCLLEMSISECERGHLTTQVPFKNACFWEEIPLHPVHVGFGRIQPQCGHFKSPLRDYGEISLPWQS